MIHPVDSPLAALAALTQVAARMAARHPAAEAAAQPPLAPPPQAASPQAASPQAASPDLPPLVPLPQMALTRGRVHEVTGPARRLLAALAARMALAEGPVLWLRPGWQGTQLCPQGLAVLMPDPGALVTLTCPRAADVLWGLEEALRAGCVTLAVGELPQAPDLRQMRRLQLAAGEGLARNRRAGRPLSAPVGLLLACDCADSRMPGAESRWALHPLPPVPGAAGAPPAPHLPLAGRWRLDRLLMRGQPPRDWPIEGAPLPDTPPRQSPQSPPPSPGSEAHQSHPRPLPGAGGDAPHPPAAPRRSTDPAPPTRAHQPNPPLRQPTRQPPPDTPRQPPDTAAPAWPERAVALLTPPPR